MRSITTEEAQRLAMNSLAFAVLLKDEEIEDVVITFMDVLHQRKMLRGDQVNL